MSRYTSLYITETVIKNYNEKLVNLIRGLYRRSSTCSSLALGVNLSGTPTEQIYDPFPQLPRPSSTVVRSLVLVIPEEELQYYMNSTEDEMISKLNSEQIFNNSLGHCWFVWDKEKNICSLWDICLHVQTGGKGTVFLDAIMGLLSLVLPDDTKLWLGIDLQNRHFNKVASLYAKFGFKDPYISFVDPFGNDYTKSLADGFLALHRTNEYIDYTEINRDGIFASILYMFEQSINNAEHNFCTIKLKFNVPYSRWLSRLALYSSSLNSNGTITQKEVSGAFKLEDPIMNSKGEFIWEIKANKEKGLNAKNELEVEIVTGRYNFHTHPREAYLNFGVNIGFPSGQDYYMVLYNILNTDLIFHSVVAVEGVYTIWLNEYWCQNLTRLVDLIKTNKDNFSIDDQKVTVAEYIRVMFEAPKIIPEGLTSKQASIDYCYRINGALLLKGEPPVFKCNFLSWDDIARDDGSDIFTVTYPKMSEQCFAPESSIDAYKNFQGKITRFRFFERK